MKCLVSGLTTLLLLSACGSTQQVAQNVANNVQVKVDNSQQNELLGKIVDKLNSPSPGASPAATGSAVVAVQPAATNAPVNASPVPTVAASSSPAPIVLSPGEVPTPAQAITIIDCGSAALAKQQPENTELKSELARYKRTAQAYTINRASQTEWAAAYTPIAQAFERADLKPFMQGCF